jgi:hypothetical protein
VISCVESVRPKCYRRLESVKRSLYLKDAEESPGSNGSERQVTPGECELTESAAERKPPDFCQVRVKRCGKSAPRGW